MNRLHDQFLSPIDSNEFFENYWEQRYLHIQRNCAEYFSNVFSATELENYLSTNAAFYPDVLDD